MSYRDDPNDDFSNLNGLNIFGYRNVDDYRKKSFLKICADCKYYNRNRRNEDGQARCSKHPFWVNNDDTCDSFEKRVLITQPTQKPTGSKTHGTFYNICVPFLIIIIPLVLLILCGTYLAGTDQTTHSNTSYSYHYYDYTSRPDISSFSAISFTKISIPEFTVSVDTHDSSQSVPQTIIVYITETGVKYHRSNCQYLYESKYAIDLEKAVARGYTRCSKCNPPR